MFETVQHPNAQKEGPRQRGMKHWREPPHVVTTCDRPRAVHAALAHPTLWIVVLPRGPCTALVAGGWCKHTRWARRSLQDHPLADVWSERRYPPPCHIRQGVGSCFVRVCTPRDAQCVYVTRGGEVFAHFTSWANQSSAQGAASGATAHQSTTSPAEEGWAAGYSDHNQRGLMRVCAGKPCIRPDRTGPDKIG
jgi:hypothetical protein